MTGRFAEKYGPWVFVAGASTGIGAALSHEAARRGQLAHPEVAGRVRAAAAGLEARTGPRSTSLRNIRRWRIASGVGQALIGAG